MSLAHCRECDRRISTAASSCPHCGAPAPITTESLDFERRADEGLQRIKRDSKKALWVGGAVLFALFAWLSSIESPPLGDPLSASVRCKGFVKERLKAPSTAEFADYRPEMATDLGSGRYRIRSWVEAENSFGARLRTSYTCTVRYEDGTAYLESIDDL